VKGMGRLLLRVVAGFFAAVLALSLVSFNPNDPHFFASSTVGMGHAPQNVCGLVGAYLAGLMQTIVGIGAWIFPIYLIWETFPTNVRNWHRRIAWFTLSLSIWTMLGAFGSRTFKDTDGLAAGIWRWGGWVGSSLWPSCKAAFGPVGLPLLLSVLSILSVFIIAPSITTAFGTWLAKRGIATLPVFQTLPKKGFQGFIWFIKNPFRIWRKGSLSNAPEISGKNSDQAYITQRNQMEKEQQESFERAERENRAFKISQARERNLPTIESMHLGDEELESIRSILLTDDNDLAIDVRRRVTEDLLPLPPLLRDIPPPEPSGPLLVDPLLTTDRFGRVIEQPSLGLKVPPEAQSGVAHQQKSQGINKSSEQNLIAPTDRRELPPKKLFSPSGPGSTIDQEILKHTQSLIGKKLSEFRVNGQVVGMQPGPVVTVYEFQPDPG